MPAFWNPNSLPYVIDWSAWATLVVGIAAVIGAFVIGLRQVGIAGRQADITFRQAEIMDRQTHIAERQAETERTRLRAELYDRRVLVFTGIEQFLEEALIRDGAVTPQLTESFNRSMSIAPFLLGKDVEELGRSIAKIAYKLRLHMSRLDRTEDLNLRTEMQDRAIAMNTELHDSGKTLKEMMEQYLSLRYEDGIES